MQFKVDLKIFLFLILFYITGQLGEYAVILILAFVHELGHLLAGIILGMKPAKLELKPYGISISFKINPNDYNKKIAKGNLLELKKAIVACAGPVTNLIIIIITLNLRLNIFTSLLIIYSNILLIIFNLIPMYPLDGGRIVKSLIYLLLGKKKAEKYTNNISFIFLIIVTFMGSVATFYFENMAIFLIIICLWLIYIKEDIIYKKKIKIYDLIEKTIENNVD